MNTTELEIQFAICITSEEKEKLELCKIYQILIDPKAIDGEHLRVIDESGEDYLYPQSWFITLDLSKALQQRLLSMVKLLGD
jgi:hypothetical protein